MTNNLQITNYSINETTIESCFKFNLIFNNINYIYELNLPSNPILDIEILRLTELNLNNKILVLKKLVKNKDYSFKSSKSLTNFILWIENIIKNTNVIYV